MEDESHDYKWGFYLSERNIDRLESCVEKEKNVHDGEIILKKGGFNRHLLILEKGLAQHIGYNKDHQEIGIKLIYSPNIIYGLESLAEEGKRKKIKKTVKILKKGKIVYLNNYCLSNFIKDNSDIRVEIFKPFTKILRSTYSSIETIAHSGSMEYRFGRKVMDLVEEYGYIENRKVSLDMGSVEKLSQILNTPQSSIIKYLKSFSNMGVIAVVNKESEEVIKCSMKKLASPFLLTFPEYFDKYKRLFDGLCTDTKFPRIGNV